MRCVPATRLPRSATRVVDDAVRQAFADGVPLSRSDLLERTGLSRSALQNAVARLQEAGDLTLAPAPDARGTGRPAQRFRLTGRARTTPTVVLDPAGTTTVVGASTDDREPARREAAHWRGDADGWTRSVAAAVTATLADAPDPDDAAVVVSVPFPFAPGRGVPLHPPVVPLPRGTPRRLPVPDWLLRDPTPMLTAAFGRPVRIVNDVNLAGLGEAHHGAARGARTALFLALREGAGAAVVVDGRVSSGANGMTGELAHVQAVPDGPLCSCGNRGCLATQTLSPSVVEALTLRSGRAVTFDDLETLVRHDDPVAVRFLVDLGRLVGGPLAAVIGFLDPDVIVLEGALGDATEPVTRGIVEVVHQRLAPVVAGALRIVRGELVRPGLVGAAVVGEAVGSGRGTAVLRAASAGPLLTAT